MTICPNRWLWQQNDTDDQVTRIGVVVFQALCPIEVWREGPKAAAKPHPPPPTPMPYSDITTLNGAIYSYMFLPSSSPSFLLSPFATPVPDTDGQVTRIGSGVVFQALCPIEVWREGAKARC